MKIKDTGPTRLTQNQERRRRVELKTIKKEKEKEKAQERFKMDMLRTVAGSEIMEQEVKGKGSEERWTGAITNLTEMASNLDSLQKLLLKKAVFVDEDTFAKASLTSEQARTIKVFLFGLNY